MPITIMKKGPKPGPKATAADSARAVQIKKRNTAINESLEIVQSYKKSYPGKDPAKLAGNMTPPRDTNSQLGDKHNIDVQMRQVRDTTMASAVRQAVRERTNAESGIRVKISKKK